MRKLAKAIKFARKAHKGQWRDGEPALPYITHPVEVVNRLAYIGEVQDEDLLCAAALHDVVEETDVTVAQIEARFGPEVARIVSEVTREEPDEET
ncbi:MAG: HD domain-containing protein, partial [Fimbriimonadaceae bacterium]